MQRATLTVKDPESKKDAMITFGLTVLPNIGDEIFLPQKYSAIDCPFILKVLHITHVIAGSDQTLNRNEAVVSVIHIKAAIVPNSLNLGFKEFSESIEYGY